MIENKRFWLAANALTLVLHAAGIGFYAAQGFSSPVTQLWALIVAIHILEIPMAFIAVQDRNIVWGATVLKTLVFGFTWWVPARRGVYHA